MVDRQFVRIRHAPVLPYVGLVLLTSLVYLNSIGTPFVWDDHEWIEGNAFVQDFDNAGILLTTFVSPRYFELAGEIYVRPLVTLSFMIDWKLWHGDPRGFHLTNIFLHVVITVLFAVAAASVVDRRAAFVSAALFAVHPIHTEAVTVISKRADLLAVVFMLVSTLAFLHVRRQRHGWWANLLGVGAFGIALLGKEVAVTLPALLALIEMHAKAPPRRTAAFRRWVPHAPYWILAGVYLVWRLGIMRVPDGLATPFGGSYAIAILNSPVMICRYLWLFLCPVNLSIFHNTLPAYSFTPAVLACLLLLGSTTVLFWRIRPRWPVGWCAWLGILLTLAPALDIMPIAMSFGERFFYLPSLFASAIAGTALLWPAHAPQRPRLTRRRGAVVAIIVAVLGARTVVRNLDYGSDERLVRAAVRVGDRNAQARLAMGVAYQDRGDYGLAEAEYGRVLELEPDAWQAMQYLAEVLFAQGKVGPALRCVDMAIQLAPTHWPNFYNRAVMRLRGGQFDAGLADLRHADNLSPGEGTVRYVLVRTLAALQDDAALKAVCALPPIRTATHLQPRIDALCR